jgi:predicted ATPase
VRRLDGIPLAVELAVVHLAAPGLAALRAQMDRELAFASGYRDLPLRQQTVETTIRWSYDLLAPQEQWCFLPQTSVFTRERDRRFLG